MIAKVELNGFKGINKTYELEGPTLLQGRNGAGKSAVFQAIEYALTGEVPEGKANDVVAHFFAPAGGTVKLVDGDGNWLERGITKDAGKKKVSEVFTTSDTKDGEDVDASRWKVDVEILDLTKFLSLSPARKRDRVISLCGKGQADTSGVMSVLATSYARAIAGPAATADTLKNGKDLPDDIQALCEEWCRLRGVEEALEATIQKEPDNLSLCLTELKTTAKESRLQARRNKLDAQAAVKQLEAGVQGARAAAEQLETAEKELAAVQEEARNVREKEVRYEEVRLHYEERQESFKQISEELSQAEKDLENLPVIPDKPEEPVIRTKVRELEEDQKKLNGEYNRKKQFVDEHEKVVFQAKQVTREYHRNVEVLEGHKTQPIGQALILAGDIPDDAHENVKPLKKLLDIMAKDWQQQYDDLEKNICLLKDKDLKYVEMVNKGDVKAKKAAETIQAITKKLVELEGEVRKAEEADSKVYSQYMQKQREYDIACDRHRSVKERHVFLKTAAQRIKNEIKDAKERIDGLHITNTNVADLLVKAKKKHNQAQEASGMLKAYETEAENARKNMVAEMAWKHAEDAILQAREKLVGEAAMPIVDDINTVLTAAGRDERAYLQLENERGKTIFDIGWCNGSRRSLPALSGGESVLFCTALSLALLKRAKGRKLLMVEADPLDTANLEATLKAVLLAEESCEAVLVATANKCTAPHTYKIFNI